MASINKVTLMGNLGADPDLKWTKSTPPAAVLTLNLATSRKFTRKNGEVVDETEWHRVVVFGPGAEAVARLKKKGDQIVVEGHLRTRKYEDRDGVTRWATEVVAGNWSPGGVVFTGRAEGNRSHPADNPGEPSMPPDDVPPPDDQIPF